MAKRPSNINVLPKDIQAYIRSLEAKASRASVPINLIGDDITPKKVHSRGLRLWAWSQERQSMVQFCQIYPGDRLMIHRAK